MVDVAMCGVNRSTTHGEGNLHVIEAPSSSRHRLPCDLNQRLTLRESGRAEDETHVVDSSHVRPEV